MTGILDPDIFDDLFQSCAFAAYVELAIQSGGQEARLPAL
jgi:hypothetical protein